MNSALDKCFQKCSLILKVLLVYKLTTEQPPCGHTQHAVWPFNGHILRLIRFVSFTAHLLPVTISWWWRKMWDGE